MTEHLSDAIFLANLVATLFMLGIIWFVQIVHYPLLAFIGESNLPGYEQKHRSLTFHIVRPVMFVEGVTAALMLLQPPRGVPREILGVAALLLVVAWVSTAFIQVPCHQRLSNAYDLATFRRLIRTNWIRTTAWTARSLLLIGIAWTFLLSPSRLTSQESGQSPAALHVGDPAPDFTATTHDGKTVSLHDFRDRRGLVIFFYPKDGTAICTKEACAFRDSYEKFLAAGVEVMGVSGDTNESHQKFAQDHRLKFPLISDADGSLRKLFQVPSTWGVVPGRVTYVIDQSGIIRQIYSALFASDEHVQQALRILNNPS